MRWDLGANIFFLFEKIGSKSINPLVGRVNLWFDLRFNPFMGSPRKPLVLVSHIERIFPHFLPYKLWSEEVNQLMVYYSFVLELIRQKVGEDSFDVGYQNHMLPRTSHKWVESEVELEVNSTYTASPWPKEKKKKKIIGYIFLFLELGLPLPKTWTSSPLISLAQLAIT